MLQHFEFHCCYSKAHRVINLEMAKILKEKGFNDALPGQKLCRQCVTEYEKLTKPPENEITTEIIETENSQDKLALNDVIYCMNHQKRNLT